VLDDTNVLDAETASPPVAAPAPGTSQRHPVMRWAGRVWLWPALLTAMLGFLQISRPEMWQDELVTVRVSGLSITELFELAGKVDAVHTLYYLIMHVWVSVFGDSPTAMRAPSALAMAGAAACLALIGQRLFGYRAGLLGGLTFALIPMITRFAQEARSYGLVVFAVALSTLLLLRALERSSRWRWAGYAATVAVIAALNIVALAALAGHGIGLLLHWRRHNGWGQVWRFALAALAGIVIALPVAIAASGQADRQIAWIQTSPLLVLWSQTVGSPKIALVLVVLALGAWFTDRWSAAVATAFAVVPMIAVWLMSLGDLNYFFSKYLLFTLPAWAVLAGAGLAALRLRVVCALALIVVGVLSIPSQTTVRGEGFHSWYNFPEPRPADMMHYSYAGAARLVTAGYQPGDAIVYGGRTTWWWYMHDVGVAYYLPDSIRMRDVFLAPASEQPVELYSLECTDPAACIGPEQRLWVVAPRESLDPLLQLTSAQAAAVSATYRIVSVQHAPGFTVALLERKTPALH
jgi:mannosyltransferase